MVAAKNPRVEFWSGKVLYPAIVVLLVLSAFFGFAILPRLLEATHALVGTPAPPLVLPVLAGTDTPAGQTGRSVDLAALKGRMIVLDFWAPWCAPCRQEMPLIDRVAKKMAAEGVVVLGVVVDPDHEGARQFVKQTGIGYGQLEDEGDKAARAYVIKTIPSIVVIDRLGVVRSYRTGFASEEDLEHSIRRAM